MKRSSRSGKRKGNSILNSGDNHVGDPELPGGALQRDSADYRRFKVVRLDHPKQQEGKEQRCGEQRAGEDGEREGRGRSNPEGAEERFGGLIRGEEGGRARNRGMESEVFGWKRSPEGTVVGVR